MRRRGSDGPSEQPLPELIGVRDTMGEGDGLHCALL